MRILRAGIACVPFLAGACAAPEPLDLRPLPAAIHARAEPGVVGEALELARLAALPVPDLGRSDDPDDAGVWQRSALAFAPEIVAARRAALRVREDAALAGSAGAIDLEAEQKGFSGDDRETRVALTFDLLGLLGSGRKGAVVALADVRTREALSALESASWHQRFEVDRARVRVAIAATLCLRLDSVLEGARADFRRAELLRDRGWIAADEFDRAAAVFHAFEAMRAQRQQAVADERNSLALRCGLPLDAPGLYAIGAATYERVAPEPLAPLPSHQALMERHPRLRRARLEVAIAEAQLRSAAALAWPELRLGPQWTFTADDALPGGMLQLSAESPWTVERAVAVARQDREAARESLEAELLAQTNECARARAVAELAIASAGEHAAEVDRATGASFTAARARFAVDASRLGDWAMELDRRSMGLVESFEHLQRARLASLDYAEAIGPSRDEVSP